MLSDRQIDHSDKNMMRMRWALDKNIYMTSAWCAIRMRWAGFCFATLRPTLARNSYGSHSGIDLSDLPTALSSRNELSPWHCSLIFWERQATVEASTSAYSQQQQPYSGRFASPLAQISRYIKVILARVPIILHSQAYLKAPGWKSNNGTSICNPQRGSITNPLFAFGTRF